MRPVARCPKTALWPTAWARFVGGSGGNAKSQFLSDPLHFPSLLHPQPSAPKWDSVRQSVYIEYVNGSDECSGNLRRKTRIDFYCPDDDSEVCVHWKEAGPVHLPRTTHTPCHLFFQKSELRFLLENKQTCTYFFEWYTEAACPVHIVYGEDCRITDSVTGVCLRARGKQNLAQPQRPDLYRIHPIQPPPLPPFPYPKDLPRPVPTALHRWRGLHRRGRALQIRPRRLPID